MANSQQSSDGWVTHNITSGKVALYLLGGLACVPLGLYLLSLGSTKAGIAGAILLLVGPLLFLKTLRLMMSGGYAFRYNSQGIEVPGLLYTRRLRWADVRKVGVMEHSTYALGFIKTSSVQHLYLKPNFGFKLYVPTSWAGMAQPEMHKLGSLFEKLRARGDVPSNTPAFSQSAEEPQNEYADAVVARYMANKLAAEKQVPTGGFSSSGFGTRSNAPQPSSGVTFGKRQI
jgi:hypothetical protein